MIKIGEKEIDQLMIGEMGVQSAYIGESNIYSRFGSFCFIELRTEKSGEGDNKNGWLF